LVAGDVDPHLGVELGLVRRVGCGEGGGDVLEALLGCDPMSLKSFYC
jgi:hypothetical protein